MVNLTKVTHTFCLCWTTAFKSSVNRHESTGHPPVQFRRRSNLWLTINSKVDQYLLSGTGVRTLSLLDSRTSHHNNISNSSTSYRSNINRGTSYHRNFSTTSNFSSRNLSIRRFSMAATSLHYQQHRTINNNQQKTSTKFQSKSSKKKSKVASVLFCFTQRSPGIHNISEQLPQFAAR